MPLAIDEPVLFDLVTKSIQPFAMYWFIKKWKHMVRVKEITSSAMADLHPIPSS